MTDTDNTEETEQDVVRGEDAPPIIINQDGLAGASQAELELLLRVLQETTFVEWTMKLLAGGVQRRVDSDLKQRIEG